MYRLVPFLALLTGTSLAAETKPPARAGRTVAAFRLPDAGGRVWTLADLRDRKAIVVLFIGTECPINNAYMPRLVELHRSHAARGVQVLAINANCQDTPRTIAAHARKHALPFPVLRDAGSHVADDFGARRTPEAFVLDGKGRILYQGRIDDQYGVGYRRKAPTRRDLIAALDEVLAGKPVSVPATPVAGCLIARVPKPKADGRITYSKHVARILQKHCQECHRPGQIGPMPLVTYNDARSWSDMIAEVVRERRMPPWHADPRHGKFANDRRLSKEERDTLLQWINDGCPRGDGGLPPPRQFAAGWRIGKPDVVFTMLEEATVPAESERKGIPYRYFVVPTRFREDRWIQAAEARPGNRNVVHHIIVYVVPPGHKRRRTPDGIGDGFLVAFAPGDLPAVFPEGTARKIPRGSILLFQMHYTPSGTEQTDRSSVGLIFSKKPPRLEVRTRSIAQRRLSIPAGAANHEVHSVTTFDRDVELLSLFPHMHLRGKDFAYRAVFPDGKTQTLLSVPRYDFNWQNNYRLAAPLRLPAGTRIECTAHFDNSAGNPNNPDPMKPVRWGDQTWEEMMIGFVDYAYVGEKKAAHRQD